MLTMATCLLVQVMEGETKAKRVREETSPSPLRGEEATSAAAAREPLGVAEDYYLPRNGNEQQEKVRIATCLTLFAMDCN